MTKMKTSERHMSVRRSGVSDLLARSHPRREEKDQDHLIVRRDR
jgi:hypothetical protein